MISDELGEYAETPDRFAPVPAGSSVTRFADERICVIQGPTWAGISGPRVRADELDELIALVHELVPADKRQVWWIGPSARPENIIELLEARGFRPAEDGPECRALVLTAQPPESAPGIAVHRVETYEDFAAARQVQWDAFEVPEGRRELQRTHMRTEFEESIAHGTPITFLATLDDKPAATGMALPSARGVFLIAGATATWARGRGLYRALVRARWDFAVERGTPALVTEALIDTSYPILRRLGFVEVCTIRRLEETRA
ncbi:MAG: acetyltransferase [Actinomycetia bacterium]|nr:acetyltransferase [Actinomycetes bacterium]